MTDQPKRNKVIDPDTNEEIQDAKRPKIQLDEGKKVSCLQALVSSYAPLLNELLRNGVEEMATGPSVDNRADAFCDLSVNI